MGVVAEMAQPRGRHVRRARCWRSAAPTRCSRHPSIRTPRRCSPRCPSATSPAGRASRRFRASCPGLYDRPTRLPVRAALHVRHAAPATTRPTLRPLAGRLGPLPLSAGRSRARERARSRATRASRCRATTHGPSRSSRRGDLRRVYEVRRGLFREPAQLHAVGGVSFTSRRRRRWRSSASRGAASPRWRAWWR